MDFSQVIKRYFFMVKHLSAKRMLKASLTQKNDLDLRLKELTKYLYEQEYLEDLIPWLLQIVPQELNCKCGCLFLVEKQQLIAMPSQDRLNIFVEGLQMKWQEGKEEFILVSSAPEWFSLELFQPYLSKEITVLFPLFVGKQFFGIWGLANDLDQPYSEGEIKQLIRFSCSIAVVLKKPDIHSRIKSSKREY